MSPASTDLASLLTASRERIVLRFVAEIQRSDLAPPGAPQSLLVDHVPDFLDAIAAELVRLVTHHRGPDEGGTRPVAREHGEQRWALGYDIDELVREYGVLRHVILAIAKERSIAVSIDEFDVLGRCLDVGIAEAAAAYAKRRDEELRHERRNLDFLGEAEQVLSSSLDFRSTLQRITRLVVPRLADWCAIHIDGEPVDAMPIAHVDPSKGDLVREIYRRFGGGSEGA